MLSEKSFRWGIGSKACTVVSFLKYIPQSQRGTNNSLLKQSTYTITLRDDNTGLSHRYVVLKWVLNLKRGFKWSNTHFKPILTSIHIIKGWAKVGLQLLVHETVYSSCIIICYYIICLYYCPLLYLLHIMVPGDMLDSEDTKMNNKKIITYLVCCKDIFKIQKKPEKCNKLPGTEKGLTDVIPWLGFWQMNRSSLGRREERELRVLGMAEQSKEGSFISTKGRREKRGKQKSWQGPRTISPDIMLSDFIIKVFKAFNF